MRPSRSKVTDAMLELVDAVRPKLIADGMFLVGLDIVGDKLMEINVFSPGGLGSCESLYKARFTDEVIAALERKVDLRRHYGELARQHPPRHPVDPADLQARERFGGQDATVLGACGHVDRRI